VHCAAEAGAAGGVFEELGDQVLHALAVHGLAGRIGACDAGAAAAGGDAEVRGDLQQDVGCQRRDPDRRQVRHEERLLLHRARDEHEALDVPECPVVVPLLVGQQRRRRQQRRQLALTVEVGQQRPDRGALELDPPVDRRL
jgi:hypothetical protein